MTQESRYIVAITAVKDTVKGLRINFYDLRIDLSRRHFVDRRDRSYGCNSFIKVYTNYCYEYSNL